MKRILLCTIVLLGILPVTAWGQSGRLANAGKAGLNVTSLEEVLRLADDQIDLATATLISSEYWSDIVQGRRYLQRLDTMALTIRARLRQMRLPLDHRAIGVINEYLFQELGFKPIVHPNDPNDLFLHSVMDRREGYCLSLSILYLALGERLGLDLYGVVVPRHFFVRYERGRVRFNIETTANGLSLPDEHYIVKFNVPDGGRNSIYMKNLTKRQTLGCFFNNLGSVYSEVGNLDMAQLALERAVAINPTLSEACGNLGNIYLRKGRTNDAVRQYRAAIELNPGESKAYSNLGNAYLNLNETKAAAASFGQAIQLDPNSVDACRGMALVFTYQEQYDQALSQLNRAVALDERNFQTQLQLGELYYRMGQYDKGLSQFRKIQGLKPDAAEAYYGLGICYSKLGRTREGIQAYTQALVLKPDLLAARVDLGTAYFDQGDYDLAIRQYQQAVASKPDDVRILFNLGSAYLKKDNFDEAVKTLLSVVRLDPKLGDAHHALAYAFYRLGRYDLAWNQANEARQLGTEVPQDLLEAIRSRLP